MSNLLQRVLTAAVAIPIILAIVMAGGVYFFLFVSLLSALGLIEFFSLTRAKGARPPVVAGVVAGIAVNLSFYHAKLMTSLAGALASNGIGIPFPTGDQLIVIVILLSAVILCVKELFRNDGSALLNLSASFMGLVYVSLFLSTFIGIREMFTRIDAPVAHYFFVTTGVSDDATIYAAGGYTVISIFAMIWLCDSAAFHVGSAFGRHKLFPRVSPNKSWEGAVAGFVVAIGAAVAAKAIVLAYLPLLHAVVLGAIVGSAGQLGDLIESLFKRDAGVKDSGSLIPGHGGVLDRFDSLLLVAPIVYLYLDFIVF